MPVDSGVFVTPGRLPGEAVRAAGAVGPEMTASGGDTGPLVTPTAPAHRSDI